MCYAKCHWTVHHLLKRNWTEVPKQFDDWSSLSVGEMFEVNLATRYTALESLHQACVVYVTATACNTALIASSDKPRCRNVCKAIRVHAQAARRSSMCRVTETFRLIVTPSTVMVPTRWNPRTEWGGIIVARLPRGETKKISTDLDLLNVRLL